ncbi:hypothetical protein [Dyella terrae]|uniref:hypothetical protein n=1 Tax=Dyella terrae TaxID=522259 RepID=UPI001EFEA080|nr:hypothetical protein [Dyella terrae]ULU24550.1 hypothetical protein DYST_01466 [Dyella terrae]
MKARIATLMMIACLAVGSVHAASNTALEHMLKQSTHEAPPDQAARMHEAIASSPALEAQLNALIASGLLTRFAIGVTPDQVPRRGPFSAWIHESTWAFSDDFIGKHGKQRLFDVVQPDDILPDNLVFALGHMAYEAKTAKELATEEASLQATYKEQAASGNHDATALIKQSVALHINNDATATIQGWNDTVDAAQHENGGKPLTARQSASLMMNLQYRGALIKAMQAPGDGKMQIGNDGRVEMTPANIAAVANALSTSSIFDVQ